MKNTCMQQLGQRSRVFGIVILFLLAGCGGGGGGGGASTGGAASGSGFSVTLNQTSINFEFTEGSSASPIAVIATATGTPPSTIYVGAIVEGNGVSDQIPMYYPSDTQVRFDISPAGGLAVGTHTGRVIFYACSDNMCANPIGGTPLAVNYSVVVKPTFKVTPSLLTLNAVSGTPASATLQIQLPNDVSSYSPVVTGGAEWLELGTHTSTNLPVTAKAWRSGTYTGEITLTANGLVTSVPVYYVVTPPSGGEADLTVTPANLTFTATENTVAPTKSLGITLPTWGSNNDVQIATQYGSSGSSGSWLTVTRTSNGADVVASAASLTQGTYTATLRFTPSAPGTAVNIPVSFTVGQGLVQPADASITVNAETTSAALSGSAPINIASGSPIAWTAVSSASWLQLTRAAGNTGTSVDYTVDINALSAQENFTERSATITISGASPLTPVQFQVSLLKALPEVHYLGPYLLVSGKQYQVHIRGRGFDGLQDLTGRLQTTGLSASNVSRSNDSTIIMQVSPSGAANHAISVSNALGLTATSATLRVVAPQTYGYAAVPTGGNKRALVLDAQRQSLYAVNVGTEAITRFRHQSGNWSIDATPVPAVLDAGMAPDGNSLIVTATPGTLRLLDPDTLNTTFSLTHTAGFARNFTYQSQGIQTTNNGWSWLTTGNVWNGLSYFDHRSRTIQPRPTQSNLQTTFYSGPWASVSRNGERMLLSQSASITPSPPMLYLDATESLLRVNPAGLTWSYNAWQSDDGDRVLFDWYSVRNRDFALIGNIPALGNSYFGVSGAMSPDGTRAYVLAYRNDAMHSLPTTIMPRVFVFDSSTAGVSSTDLPLLGHFDLQHYPTCRESSYSCNYRPHSAISPDGQTLFFIGDQNLVVTPTALPVSGSSLQLQGQKEKLMQRWSPVIPTR